MSAGRVRFVGCGPGAADLLTLRAARALESADVVIWNASLLERDVLRSHMRADAELVSWPPATQQDIEAVYDRAVADGLIVVRLKGGVPMLFGAIEPDLAAAHDRGLACEVVPGVSAVGTAAAVLQREIATTGSPLVLAAAGALAAAAGSERAIAVHGASRDPEALQRDLLALGLAPQTPCDVAVDVSRRGETLVACTLEELAETVRDTGLGGLTLVLVRPSATAPRTPSGS